MTIKDLKEIIKNLPNDLEICDPKGGPYNDIRAATNEKHTSGYVYLTYIYKVERAKNKKIKQELYKENKEFLKIFSSTLMDPLFRS